MGEPSPLDALLGPAPEEPKVTAKRAHVRRQQAAAQKRKDKCLLALAQGATVEDAAKAGGVTKSAYEKWCATDPEFRKQRDQVRLAIAQAKKEGTDSDDAEMALDGTFTTFRKAMFGLDTYWHQAEIVRAIESAPEMGVTLVTVPPEHGKTTLLVDYICYVLGNNPNSRITFVSEGQPHAKKVVSQVKNRMTRADLFPSFIHRFGPFHIPGEDSDKAWTTEYITVSKSDHDERDYSLEARGASSAIAGTRADLMLIDDVQSLRSLSQTKKLLEVIRQDFITRVSHEGRIIVVGTRVGETDIYQAMLDADLVERYVNLPAMDKDGEPLCPEMWPKDKLKKRKKQVGEDVWWRTYQQRPRGTLAKTFTAEALERSKDGNLTLGGLTTDGRSLLEGKFRQLHLDPALGGQNALTASAYNDDEFVLLDSRYKTGLTKTEQILEDIEELAIAYRPAQLVIEVNAMQRGIARDDRLEEAGRQHGFRVVEHETGSNKTDPMYGIAQMPTDFRAGRVRIPWADEASRSAFQDLVDQLERWRPDVPVKLLQQDTVMSLWFGWLQWDRARGNARKADTTAWRRQGVGDLMKHTRSAA